MSLMGRSERPRSLSVDRAPFLALLSAFSLALVAIGYPAEASLNDRAVVRLGDYTAPIPLHELESFVHGIHGGDRASHGIHGGDRASAGIHGGDRSSHGIHGGDRASYGIHGGDRASAGIHGGDRSSHGIHGGDRASHGIHGGDRNVQTSGSTAADSGGALASVDAAIATISRSALDAFASIGVGPVESASDDGNHIQVLGQLYDVSGLAKELSRTISRGDYVLVGGANQSKDGSIAGDVLVVFESVYVPGSSPVYLRSKLDDISSLGLLKVRGVTVDAASSAPTVEGDLVRDATVDVIGTQPVIGGVVLPYEILGH